MTGLDAALTQLNKRFEAEPEQFREADLRPLAQGLLAKRMVLLSRRLGYELA